MYNRGGLQFLLRGGGEEKKKYRYPRSPKFLDAPIAEFVNKKLQI